MLKVKQLCKRFGSHQVINAVDLNVTVGDRRVILGPNGAGKTTLFQLLSGNIMPDSGSIVFDSQEITKLSVEKRTRLGVGRSFQTNNLFETLSVLENLQLAIAGRQRFHLQLWRDDFSRPSIIAEIEELSEKLSLDDVLYETVKHLPYGSRRQLEIALAVAQKPKLLLLDEPTSGVDPEHTELFHQLLLNLPKDMAIVVIEHDLDLAFAIASSITVLHMGSEVFTGSPQDTKNNSTVKEIYLGDWQAC